MRRSVFGIATLISLLFCLGELFAHTRGFADRYETYVGHLAPEEDQSATVYGLRFQYGCTYFVFKSGQTLLPDFDFHVEAWRNQPTDGWRNVNGFEVLSYETSPPGSVYYQLIVPDRRLAGFFALLPAYAVIRLIFITWRRVTRKPGACRGCGYDLTGNASGMCPECGRPLPGIEVQTSVSQKIARDTSNTNPDEIVAAINSLVAGPAPESQQIEVTTGQRDSVRGAECARDLSISS